MRTYLFAAASACVVAAAILTPVVYLVTIHQTACL
jgi:hypothetical protein